MRETHVESYLQKQVSATGGLCRKWVSPGRRHVPDRICIWPDRIVFVELKKPGEEARPGQLREHAALRRRGCDVRVIDTKQKVDELIDEICSA